MTITTRSDSDLGRCGLWTGGKKTRRPKHRHDGLFMLDLCITYALLMLCGIYLHGCKHCKEASASASASFFRASMISVIRYHSIVLITRIDLLDIASPRAPHLLLAESSRSNNISGTLPLYHIHVSQGLGPSTCRFSANIYS